MLVAAAAGLFLSSLAAVAAESLPAVTEPTVNGLTKNEWGQMAFYFGAAMLGLNQLLGVIERAASLKKTFNSPSAALMFQPIQERIAQLEAHINVRFQGVSDSAKATRTALEQKIDAQGVRTDELIAAVGGVQGELRRIKS